VRAGTRPPQCLWPHSGADAMLPRSPTTTVAKRIFHAQRPKHANVWRIGWGLTVRVGRGAGGFGVQDSFLLRLVGPHHRSARGPCSRARSPCLLVIVRPPFSHVPLQRGGDAGWQSRLHFQRHCGQTRQRERDVGARLVSQWLRSLEPVRWSAGVVQAKLARTASRWIFRAHSTCFRNV